jgi:DNA-binding NarL/FixJ family response regulator
MIKIFIADDHPIVLDGLRSAINAFEGKTVVGVASNGKDALQQLEILRPDILLTDISMPEMNGIELAREAIKRYSSLKVIIMSMHESDAYINNAIEAGAHGYLLKDAEKNELSEAFDLVMEGGKYFSKTVSQILMNGMFKPGDSDGKKKVNQGGLSNREVEVLRLIAQGLSNKEIGVKLFLSTRTIDAHRYNIMQKLEVKNTAEMIKAGVKLKLVEF